MTLDRTDDRVMAYTYQTKNTAEECAKAAHYVVTDMVPECVDCDDRNCQVCQTKKQAAYELLDMLGLTGDKQLATNIRPSRRTGRAVRHYGMGTRSIGTGSQFE